MYNTFYNRLIILFTVIFLYYGYDCFASGNGERAQDNSQSSKPLRTLEFAGVTWNVKSGGPYGPGPNYWSDSPQDVWVDDQGQLHLKIVKKGNVWFCTEVYTTAFTTYGEHRFLIDGFIDRMDKNIVLGLFIYAADDAEVDIEYSKWGGGPSYKKVGGYTIQPYTIPGNNFKFESPLSSSESTQYFNWQPDSVTFGSIQGHHYNEPTDPGNYIKQWTYTGTSNPDVSRNLRTHINFWLFGGNVPTDLSVMEVVVRDLIQPLNAGIKGGNQDSYPPVSMELYQNYPNPFNAETTIGYQLFENSKVELSVFDNSGRIIQNLVNEEQSPNSYRIKFSGQAFSSGIYYFQLKTDKKIETKKMLLIR